MPSYKVLQKGFYEGKLYDPEGKRKVLHKSGPFAKKGKTEQVPAWLEPIKAETTAEKKKRQAASKATKDEVESDKKDISEASFMGDGESSSNVETL